MPLCIYCNTERNVNEMTKEHVIPTSIGGNLAPKNPFLLSDVCKRCNSLCGAYIDGQFIKAWFTQNYKTQIFHKYADITRSPVLPLMYMGISDEISYRDKICEFWLGPTGDTIYHFHSPYPEEPHVAPMIGVPSFAKRKEIDPGFAFLFVRSNNPVWHPTIFYSFVAHFKDSKLFLGNGPTPQGGRFSDIPSDLLDLYLKLQGMAGQIHRVKFKMSIFYGDRFLAKLALGLGALFLRQSFIGSDSAGLLRTFMWTKNSEERNQLSLTGTGFLGRIDDNLKKIMNWPGGHIIALIQTGKTLNLYTSFFEIQCGVIRVSSEPEHWEGLFNEGLIFVISPGLQKYVGPKNWGTYIAHKVEPTLKDPDLLMLEEEMNNTKRLPLFDI